MIEKVNPQHPDKVADRIAGAIVDRAYEKSESPKMAVEVLIGHGRCFVIMETSEMFFESEVEEIVERIAGKGVSVELVYTSQDRHLAENQDGAVRCGDNGIFKGMPITEEEQALSQVAHDIYEAWPTDGKYILADHHLTICQSHARNEELRVAFPKATINPLGEWTGGIDVDSGATNRKLGSDMARGVTGGGLHGKDLSKADVSVNIYAFLKAQETGQPVELHCAIGDTEIDGRPYAEIVEIAGSFIKSRGGFERFAEWGLF